MKMKGRKVTCFIWLNIIYIIMFFFTLFFAPDVLHTIGKWLLFVFFANGITFIGGNTLDKWIVSANFQKDLFDKEE